VEPNLSLGKDVSTVMSCIDTYKATHTPIDIQSDNEVFNASPVSSSEPMCLNDQLFSGVLEQDMVTEVNAAVGSTTEEEVFVGVICLIMIAKVASSGTH